MGQGGVGQGRAGQGKADATGRAGCLVVRLWLTTRGSNDVGRTRTPPAPFVPPLQMLEESSQDEIDELAAQLGEAQQAARALQAQLKDLQRTSAMAVAAASQAQPAG